MTQDTVLEVQINSDIKNQAEQIYEQLGTSLEEAVRVFTFQSVQEKGMPFEMKLPAESSANSSHRICFAKGKLQAPGDIDSGDDEIEKMFGVAE